MIWIVWLLVDVIVGFYAMLILGYYVGFKRIYRESKTVSDTRKNHSFSVVIAARNEEGNINNILQDLVNQNYPDGAYEIIIVDDDSQDKTFEKAEEFLQKTALSFRLLQSSGGKKKALATALQNVNNEIIIFSDADCRLPVNWLNSFNVEFCRKPLMLVAGPVIFPPKKSILSRWFSLEFAALVASGAGAIGIKRPVMVNGANLAVRQDAILKYMDIVYSTKEASGDDVFLMSEIRKEFGSSKISFINSKDALVKTPSPESLKVFINQRIRWTSKSKAYSDVNIIYSAVVVLIYNLFQVILFLLAVFYSPYYFFIYLTLLLLKTIIDLPLLVSFLKKYDLISLWIWIFPLQIIYPFYIVIIGTLGQFMPFSWRGRKGRQT